MPWKITVVGIRLATLDAMAFILFPFQASADLTVSGMFTGLQRCGAPTVLGMSGVEKLSNEPVRVVACEWPTSYKPSTEKAAKELQHLNRFNVDVRAATGHGFYQSITPVEDDPPDFRCVTAQGSDRGVECTQLVFQERLAAEARFRRLRLAVLGINRHRLQHLRGHVVYVALEPDSSSPVRKVPVLAKALTLGLEQHDPTIGASLVDMPAQAPEGIVTKFAGGTIMTTPLTADPGSPFFQTVGFELALSNASTLKHTEAWDEFTRLVREHDSEGVDEIVVSAEAPTTNGYSYPSDSVLAQAVLEHSASMALNTRHVEFIYLHVWSTSGVFRFTPGEPGFETVCGTLPIPPP